MLQLELMPPKTTTTIPGNILLVINFSGRTHVIIFGVLSIVEHHHSNDRSIRIGLSESKGNYIGRGDRGIHTRSQC